MDEGEPVDAPTDYEGGGQADQSTEKASTQTASSTETVGKDTSGPETDSAMTRSEEEDRIDKVSRETGKVRLRKYIVTDQVQMTVPMEREEVRVEREPMAGALIISSHPAVRVVPVRIQRRRLVTAASLLGALAVLTTACSSSAKVASSRSTTTTLVTSTSTRATSAGGPGDLSMPDGAIVVRAAVPATATTIDGSLRTPDGRVRTYHAYVPDSAGSGAASTSMPLLVALHGGTGWGRQFELNSGFDALAEANRFVVVYPDGIGIGAKGDQLRTWNGGDCCGPAAQQHVDDVGFIRLLIDRIKSQYDIDPARVVATGHSNGGIMAYRLACELAPEIAAIGVQSSALEMERCRPSRPVSVLQIHGSGDQNIPIGGGRGPKAISGVAFHRPIEAAQTLATADHCRSSPARTTDTRNRDLSITSWSRCAQGTLVAFVTVAGATHAWMGHTAGGSGKVGPPYTKLDSSLAIWNFLSQQTHH